MSENYQIDKVDQHILKRLLVDSRTSYQELARELVVSGGTIHVRINKMKEANIIKGSKIVIDYHKLGFTVLAFVGVNCHNARDYKSVISYLDKFNEVLEVYYTTGNYSLFIKVIAKNIKDLYSFLGEKLQTIEEIQSTETLISLDIPINRDLLF